MFVSAFRNRNYETWMGLLIYPNNVKSILSDESLYPLYAKRGKGETQLECYSLKHDEMEEYIENFLKSTFSENIDFIQINKRD